MKHILPLVLFLSGVNGYATEVQKHQGESDIDFARRVTQSEKGYRKQMSDMAEDNLQVAHTRSVLKGEDLLVGIVNRPDPQDKTSNHTVLNVLKPVQNDRYEILAIEACEVEGGDPEVPAFFFANADTSPEYEIGVICSWPSHREAECEAADEVRFFKVPSDFKKQKISRVKNPTLEQALVKSYKVAEHEDSKNEKKVTGHHECVGAAFKNAADVKAILKKLGFKQ